MKVNKIFKLLLFLILICFLFLYTITNSGYYEYNLNNKKNLTNKEIEEFERDIKEGKDVDINKYINRDKVDYSNNLTRVTSNVSMRANNYLKDMFIKSFHIFEKLIK